MESYGEAIGSNNTLRTVLNMCGSVGVGKARVYLKQILLALVHLHAAGFVHRSLEPEVVLLVPPASPLSTTGENNISSVSSYGAPSVKLFCVSYREKLQALNRVAPLSSLHRDARDDEDRVKRVAPEVVDHPGMIGRKCDIWSVGIIGLEMIFGRDIVESVEMGREPELLEKYRSELQQSLARVLTKMLAKQPEDRPTAMELLTDPFFSEGVPKREPSVLQLALDSASQGLRHEQNKSFVYSSHGGTTPIDQATSRPRQHSTTYFNIANLRLQPEESEIVGVGGVSIVPVEASSAAMQGLDRKAPAYSLPPIPSQDQAPSADVSSDSDTVARPRRQIVIGRHTQPAPRPSGASVAAQSGLGAPRNEAMIPTQPHMQSRYRTDFQEIEFLGKGGFGSVVKARNIIDGRFYAIKKIKLNSRKMDEGSSNKIFREVTTLSRLHHQNVVRYYTTWVEYVPKGTENIRLAGDSSEEDQDNEEASFLELDSIATFDDQSRQRGVSATSSSNGSEPSMLEMSQAPRTNPASEATDTGNGDGAGGEEGDYVSFSAEYDGQFNTDPFVGPGTTGLYSSLRFGTMGGRNVPPKARNGKKNFGITTVVPATAASSFTSYSESEDESESDNGCACDDSEISIEFESEPCEVKSNGGVAFAPKARGAQESSYASSRSVSSSSSSTTSSRGGSRALAARSRYLHQRKASADDQFDKILYIQMEYCENKTLSDLIAEGIEENEMWRLFRQTLEGLVHIHSCGMIHRDLKPVNIFLSASGDIKIGDFGLATSNYAPIEGPAASGDRQKRGSARRGGNELRGVDATFTADIGTSMYVAPEVANRSSSTHIRYNQKVDMYSLGVILFEMCYPVNTGMERANVIMRLRKQQIEFPPDFPIEQKRLQYQIIRQLLNHNPHQRPSSVELLESGLLPSKMEKEHIRETIHTIANPDQPYYNTLLSTLFSRYTDTHIDATFDYRSVNTAKEQINAVYLDRIREYMIHTFRKHAAIELTTPLMVPKLKEIGYDSFINVAQYLDASGNVVGLPVDPVIPFSRYVARTNLREIKRFCFDRFYRENSAGGQPISGNVASFDIVTNEEAHAVGASEVITVVMDILSDFPAFRNSPLVIMLNHCDVLESILFRVTQYLAEQQIGGAGNVFASLPKHRQASEIGMVYGLLRRYYSTNGSKSQVVRDEIGASLFGSTGLFNIMNNDMRSQLKKLLTGYYRDLAEYKSAVAEFLGEDGLGGFSSIYTLETRKEALIHLQRVQVAFAELEHLISTLELFEIDIDSVVYCPLFTYHRVYYRHGYCFQVLTKSKYPEVLAIGGRYDHLIKQFKYLVNDPATYPQPSAADEAIEDSTMAAAAANSSSMSLRDLVTEYKQIAHTTIARQPTTSGSAALGTGKGVVGFGACFSLDKITQSMAKFEEDLLAHSSVPSFGLWTRKRCDVVVASFGSKNLLKERVELARDLWANQIRADFLYNDDPGMSMEALMSICRDQGMNWIVTLKRKSASKADSELNSGHLSVSSSSSSLYHPREQISKFIYKVRDILQKTEKEGKANQLPI
ncbi:eukaryotic translation initiation factor 2-alpha kinase [Spiromyces aspiralis]|uniref:Eukaryotic translation initiation factor 2-alpha kinase n=1 Tax=Spiromyces aspiralis TaxID=68401 RepID=A0ACC1HSY2_9FUNG|nr:eukaryotic translation initiation factor 2-alpha kinase [Spiromyces aspiralis]